LPKTTFKWKIKPAVVGSRTVKGVGPDPSFVNPNGCLGALLPVLDGDHQRSHDSLRGEVLATFGTSLSTMEPSII